MVFFYTNDMCLFLWLSLYYIYIYI